MNQTEYHATQNVVSAPPQEKGILQRKCDCGNHSMSGNCDDCAKKKSSLQRKAAHGIESSEGPQIVHEVLRSTGEPLDAATRAFMELRLQTWLIWAQGTTSNLYGELNDARKGGDRLIDVNFAAAATFQMLARAFNLPGTDRDTPLIIHADARVSIALENNCESYIKDVVKFVGADQPPP